LKEPGALEQLKDKPFVIKEGVKFHTKVVFQVNHDVLSGLKYIQVVKRKGIRVGKDQEMLVRSDSFLTAASLPHPWATNKCKKTP
jgi:Rho GDP-dissociation inhibitor